VETKLLFSIFYDFIAWVGFAEAVDGTTALFDYLTIRAAGNGIPASNITKLVSNRLL